MKNIVLISASPKIKEKSLSKDLLETAGSRIDADAFNKTFIDVRKSILNHKLSEDFETLSNANAIIFSFPLYFFCLPGILTRFLVDYYKYYGESGKVRSNVKVYVIVNCGLAKPETNLEAVRVIRSFSQHINAEFRFGVLIGGGPMLLAQKDAPFMRKNIQKLNNSFSLIAEDIKNEDFATMDNVNIGVKFLSRFYYFMGNREWYTAARKNGLQKKDLYKKPYAK